MNPITQHEVHPDAESLNAFVEKALPAAEREQMLAHLAGCNRCREVVFLTQEAAGAEDDARVVAARPEADRPWQRWFAGWRWTWVPATALAGLVGLAVLHHFYRIPPETEVARNTPQEVRDNASAKAGPVSKPRSADSAERSKATENEAGRQTSPHPKDMGALAKKAPEIANLPAVPRDKDETSEEMKSIATASSAPVQPQSYRGEAAKAQKPSSIGGLYATSNALQQQSASQQQEIAQDQLHSARYAAKGGGAGGTVSEGSVGRADAQSAPAAPAPTAARELSSQSLANMSSATDKVALDGKMKSAVLPNGTNAVSVASAQGRTVAIDTAGSVFLRESSGGQWIPVTTQWTGRAARVRVRPTPMQAGTSTQPAVFELVNDKVETWVSADGKTWAAEPISPR